MSGVGLRYWIYFMTNTNNTVLYVGVTSNLQQRIRQHKAKELGGFTAKYAISKVIFVEEYTDIREAIAREKQIKGWSRRKKEELIATQNPLWRDLFGDTE
ncbi:MAG: GIY-YIG nuclease family protein [Alistipes sp.]|nr:GIY-YIG nuclease family protein [Alistipes sp.]